MKLIIDISEKTYKKFKNLNQIIGILSFEKDTLALIKAVKNGTPLPKGHGRLIDADGEITFVLDEDGKIKAIEAPIIIEADKVESEE